MFLFHPNDLGVKVRKGKWTVVDGENWVGGVTGGEDCCFVVAFKGKHNEMQEYLKKKLQKNPVIRRSRFPVRGSQLSLGAGPTHPSLARPAAHTKGHIQ